LSEIVDCAAVDLLVTPYLDGELGSNASQAIDGHLGRCAPCRSRVAAERAALALLRARKDQLKHERATPDLQARCAAHALSTRLSRDEPRALPRSAPAAVVSRGWRSPRAPIALAATLVLIVGAAFLVQLTPRSTRLLAAELTADHVKCFAVNAVLRTHQASEVVEGSMASGFSWKMRLPTSTDREGLELVGSRPCLYAKGKVAHIMYRHHGRPVSLFMLPRTKRSDQLVEVFGHEAAVWSVGDRTFVLIARESRSEVERMAAFVHAAFR